MAKTKIYFDKGHGSVLYGIGLEHKETVVQTMWSAGEYAKVGEIEGTKEDAFAHAQNLDRNWGRPDVRSARTGDIFVEDGQAFVCAPFGWDAIELGPEPEDGISSLMKI